MEKVVAAAACMVEPRFFPNPSILIDFSIENGKTSIGIDRSWHCGRFGLCLFWETSFCLSKLAGMLYLFIFQ